MKLDKQLERWREAELIDHETVERIKDYEANHRRPLFLYASSGIGALSLCLGLISIVASNWHTISGGIKLVIDLIIGTGLCYYLIRERERLSPWVRELLIALITGWTLASIALIGQVYQLSGDGKSAITLWTALTGLLVLQGRSTFSGVLLLGMIGMTTGLWVVALKSTHLLLAMPGLALAFFALSLYEPIYRRRPEILNVFRFVGLWSVLIAASIAPFFLYKALRPKPNYLEHLFECFFYCLPGVAWLWHSLKPYPKSARLALLASVVCTFVPPIISYQVSYKPLGILFFLGYWAIITKASIDLSLVWLFRIATFAVSSRLLIVYLELVGSLLNTGLLFITGGALTLFITRYWYQKQAELISEFKSAERDARVLSGASIEEESDDEG